MTHAIGSRTCAVLGCHRRTDTHADGRCVHARCPAHEAEALSQAFAPSEPSVENVGQRLPLGRRAFSAERPGALGWPAIAS